MKRNTMIRILVFLSFIFMVALNALANILPINGFMTGEVSDSFFNLFAPAPITFSIWALIYLLLFMYSIVQLRVNHDLSVRQNLFDDLAIPFIASNIANGLWIVAWHFLRIELSLVLIVFVLICLIIIMLEINRTSLYNNDSFLIVLPFSIYFGWISVATIANVTTLLVSLGYSSFLNAPLFGVADDVWLLAMLVVGAIVMTFTSYKFRARAYGLVFVWAYFGIYLKIIDLPKNTNFTLFAFLPQIILGLIAYFFVFLLSLSVKIKNDQYKLK